MIDQKRKGHQWERDATKRLIKLIPGSNWKRIPGSGALGTILNEPILTGDIVGSIPGITRKFKIDAKVGYGGSKQMAVKREWLEKISKEAEATHSIPMIVGKFSGSKRAIREFVVLDIETFAELMNTIVHLNNTLEEVNMENDK
jgi:hypothetical protein